MNWHLTRLRGQRIALVNATGVDAYNVTVQAQGPVVVSGRRDWSASYHVVQHEQSIEVVWGKGMSDQRPGLRISWHTAPEGSATRTRIQTVWLD